MYRRRKRNRRAQRPYQVTRYRISNVLNPDELIMKIKFNTVHTYDLRSTETLRLDYAVNGATIQQLSNTQNFADNAAKFSQIEFLSGKLSFYIINEGLRLASPSSGSTGPYPFPVYLMIGMYTRRRWYDEQLQEQVEAEIPKPENFVEMWTESAETPGYSVRLCNYITSGKGIQKLVFRASKSSFKDLKANPTGFQQNIPLPTTNPNLVLPSNAMTAIVDIVDTSPIDDEPRLETVKILVSRTLLVRFKGATYH